jgi:hypothetical protein
MRTGVPVEAERTAASTIATLITLECTSDCGTVELRTASTNSASEPAISSGSSASTAGSGSPEASSATGGWSPSQIAVPAEPTARQRPFQEVSRPGAHQLQVKANRVPSANVNSAEAAALPSNQLQSGLYDSQYTETGSAPISLRARSNW